MPGSQTSTIPWPVNEYLSDSLPQSWVSPLFLPSPHFIVIAVNKWPPTKRVLMTRLIMRCYRAPAPDPL